MQSSELDPALREDLKKIVRTWLVSLGKATEEEKASWKEGGVKMKQMWAENAEKVGQEWTSWFNESATDGICNEAQWIAFNRKLHEQLSAKGI